MDAFSRPAGEFFATTEQQVVAEADGSRDLGGARTAPTRRLARPLASFALVEVGVSRLEHDRDGLPEDRVAEELEALVCASARRVRRHTTGG